MMSKACLELVARLVFCDEIVQWVAGGYNRVIVRHTKFVSSEVDGCT